MAKKQTSDKVSTLAAKVLSGSKKPTKSKKGTHLFLEHTGDNYAKEGESINP